MLAAKPRRPTAAPPPPPGVLRAFPGGSDRRLQRNHSELALITERQGGSFLRGPPKIVVKKDKGTFFAKPPVVVLLASLQTDQGAPSKTASPTHAKPAPRARSLAAFLRLSLLPPWALRLRKKPLQLLAFQNHGPGLGRVHLPKQPMWGGVPSFWGTRKVQKRCPRKWPPQDVHVAWFLHTKGENTPSQEWKEWQVSRRNHPQNLAPCKDLLARPFVKLKISGGSRRAEHPLFEPVFSIPAIANQGKSPKGKVLSLW